MGAHRCKLAGRAASLDRGWKPCRLQPRQQGKGSAQKPSPCLSACLPAQHPKLTAGAPCRPPAPRGCPAPSQTPRGSDCMQEQQGHQERPGRRGPVPGTPSNSRAMPQTCHLLPYDQIHKPRLAMSVNTSAFTTALSRLLNSAFTAEPCHAAAARNATKPHAKRPPLPRPGPPLAGGLPKHGAARQRGAHGAD